MKFWRINITERFHGQGGGILGVFAQSSLYKPLMDRQRKQWRALNGRARVNQ
jgi:hypothetical protein